jgi:Transposase DDE domain group 1
MSSQDANQIELDFLSDLPVLVQQHEGQLTSDAGLLPIAQFDRRWNYTARMAACLQAAPADDSRQRHRKPQTEHERIEMLRQRIFGILAGYEDCNDHDTLRSDPVFKMVADRLPEDDALASQPTLSRFENSVKPADLQRLIDFTIATGIERLKEKNGGRLPASITLDLDATDDPTHGHQQLTLFHGYYGQYQYFPLIISEPTTKHVFVAWLRMGTVHASVGADDDLMRIINALRKERPDIQIHIRGDGGFGLPMMYEFCENNGLTYTFGFATNPRLKRLTADLMQRAVDEHGRTKQKQRLFDCFQYKCDSWPFARTVIAKAECHDDGTNQRFVVTNRTGVSSAEDGLREYDDYVQRGESEHRMDELKNGLHMDRLSCHRFMANFFRLILHVAAMNLLGALRQSEQLPQGLQTAQPCTWQTTLIKVAAIVVQSTRRVVVKVAANWPWWPIYQAVAARSLSFNATTPPFLTSA